MGQRFAGKVALVTGAAQGIGRATALLLAAEGVAVVLIDRAVQVCEDVKSEIVLAGGAATVVGADLETEDGAAQMVSHALEWHGTIDIAVHNVGGTIWTKPFWEYSIEEVDKELRRSLWPTLLCSRAVIPVMIKQKRGAIVNIGSTATRGLYRVPYAAAKGGVAAMTVAMSMELAQFGVRVNCVVPGYISSNRVIPRNSTPPGEKEKAWRNEIVVKSVQDASMARAGEAKEVAAAIAFFASEDSSFITGEILHVSGGAIG